MQKVNRDLPSPVKTQASVSDKVLINLRRIIQAIDLHSRQLARQHGITTPQLIILKQIQGKETMTVSEVARQVSLKQATVTDILNRLERKGLVLREKDTKDRRRVLISARTETPLQQVFAPAI